MTLTLQLPVPSPKLRSNGSYGNRYVYQKTFREHKALAKLEAGRVLKDAGFTCVNCNDGWVPTITTETECDHCKGSGITPPRWKRARYVVTQYHTGPQRLDPGNLIAACKAYEDGIAAAGIVENDKHLYPEGARFVRTDRLPRLEIEITETHE